MSEPLSTGLLNLALLANLRREAWANGRPALLIDNDIVVALVDKHDALQAENARLTSEVSRLEKQNKTMSHNLRVGFQREEALTKELDDLTRAIIELFSPATAKRLAVLAPQEANDEEDGND